MLFAVDAFAAAMTDRPLTQSPIARMAWALSGAISLLAIENVWIDPWVATHSHHRLPSFVPQPLTGTWLLVLMALVIGLILAVICQLLLFKDSRLAVWKRTLTALVVLVALLLSAKWVVATGGPELFSRQQILQTKHSVTLRWNASTTPGIRYNIYRGNARGLHIDKLNAGPLTELSFVDTQVEHGGIYYYVIRAVDSVGRESSDSNEVAVTIP